MRNVAKGFVRYQQFKTLQKMVVDFTDLKMFDRKHSTRLNKAATRNYKIIVQESSGNRTLNLRTFNNQEREIKYSC